MRQKIARSMRKWADLIDPRVKPSDAGVLTVRVDCDATDFLSTAKTVSAEIERLIALQAKVPGLRKP
jgi:hypothetical protein